MVLKHVKMPNLGESVHEAEIVEWLVQPGDKVNKYDPLLEAQSDKVVTEVPSEYEGVVKEILVDVEEMVDVGTEIMTIEVEGAAGDEELVEEVVEAVEEEKEQTPPKEEKASAPKKEKQSKKPQDGSAPRFSPAVVRIAQERGINLDDVPGTGKNGRITRKDIKNFDPSSVETTKVEETEETPTDTSPAKEEDKEKTVSAPKSKVEAGKREGNKTYLPVDGVRKAIAKNMTKSETEIPHAWIMVEADVSNIVKLRNETKDKFKEQEGVTLSFFPFFVKAVAQALKDNPLLNSSWDEKNIILHHDINISIAVATEDHLYVPVIKNADNYSVAGIAKEIDRLAEGARNGSLSSDDMSGGTITVNNTGSFGSVQSMGIINHPQAAILQIEAIQERIVPVENGFKTAHMANLSLSIDHRILDGLQSGKFLKDVKENLTRYTNEANIY